MINFTKIIFPLKFKKIWALLFFGSLLIAGAPSPQQVFFITPKLPTLVMVGTKEDLNAWEPEFRNLIETDEALDFRVVGMPLREDLPSEQLTSVWFRVHFKLADVKAAPRIWVLLGRDGQALASGKVLPQVEEVISALEAAGERSPVAILKRFLRTHPDHMEARRDLIQGLRRCVTLRLRSFPPGEGKEHSPDEDSNVWKSIALEMGVLFQSAEWVPFHVSLDELLPKGAPEARSPLIKAFYRRLRPRLVEGILRFPENPTGWKNLLRIDKALGNSDLLSVMGEVSFYHPPTNALSLIPFGPLSLRIHEEARRTGNWRGAAHVLQGLWEHAAKPKLTFYDRGWIATTGTQVKGKDPELFAREEKEEVLEQLLAPLIEALVRGGAESEVSTVLADLDEGWSSLPLAGRLRRLAREIGRVDLASGWESLVQRAPLPRVPREGMLGAEYNVFYSRQGGWQYREGLDPLLLFKKEGISVDIREVPASWIPRLGWTEPSPRWAWINHEGKVLLEGGILPKPESLLASFLDLRIPTKLEKVQTYLAEHPRHIQAMAFMATFIHSQTAAMAQVERSQSPSGYKVKRQDDKELGLWQEYYSLVRNLGEDPLGTCPVFLNRYMETFPSKGTFDKGDSVESLGANDLAHRLLPELEAQLARWPSERAFWSAWLRLAGYLERSPAGMLNTLEPSPLASNQTWPFLDVLIQAAQDLNRQGRWQSLVALLQPRMNLKIQETRKRIQEKGQWIKLAFNEQWSSELTQLLIVAYTHLSQPDEIVAIRDAYKAVGSSEFNP